MTISWKQRGKQRRRCVLGLRGKRKVDGLAYQEKSAPRMVKALFDRPTFSRRLTASSAVPLGWHRTSALRGKAVSIITWMEVMVGAADDVEDATRSFLGAVSTSLRSMARLQSVPSACVAPITSNCPTPLSGQRRRHTRCSWSRETPGISQPSCMPASACLADCETTRLELAPDVHSLIRATLAWRRRIRSEIFQLLNTIDGGPRGVKLRHAQVHNDRR